VLCNVKYFIPTGPLGDSSVQKKSHFSLSVEVFSTAVLIVDTKEAKNIVNLTETC